MAIMTTSKDLNRNKKPVPTGHRLLLCDRLMGNALSL